MVQNYNIPKSLNHDFGQKLENFKLLLFGQNRSRKSVW